MGKDVQIAPVAIMQGNLNVEIQTTQDVSQPGYLWLRPFLAAWLPEKEMNRAVEETMAPLIKELER